jgi:hypothetical protein
LRGPRTVNRVMRAPVGVSRPRIRTTGNGSSNSGGNEDCEPELTEDGTGAGVTLGRGAGEALGVGEGDGDGLGAGRAAWTTVVGSDWRTSEPAELVTVRRARSVEPTSAVATRYLSDVAPAIGEQASPATEHRSHRQVAAGVGSPVHMAVVVSV